MEPGAGMELQSMQFWRKDWYSGKKGSKARRPIPRSQPARSDPTTEAVPDQADAFMQRFLILPYGFPTWQ